MDINKIIDDFESCRNKTCKQCEASKPIDSSDCSYCELLDTYARRLRDRITELIEHN